MALSLAEVLALPAVQAGRPLLLTGSELTDRPVRWVHIGEVPDLATMLRGGELVLTTGVALPNRSRALARYVAELAAAGACALAIELGDRFDEVPVSMVAAGREHQLPIVALRRKLRFVAVTEAVHALILDQQYEQLRLSERAHVEFTELSVEGASVQQILDRLRTMSGHPVVLEDVARRVVAYSCDPEQVGQLLAGWNSRSRLAPSAETTGTTGPEEWLATPVGPRRGRWGRLVLPAAGGEALSMLLERAAEALAINRLVERDRISLVQQAHRGLLTDLQLGRALPQQELKHRAEALGLPTSRHSFVGIAIGADRPAGLDPVAAEAQDRVLAEAAVLACRRSSMPTLAAPARAGRVQILAALPAGRSLRRALEKFTAELADLADRADRSDQAAPAAGGDPYAVGVGPQVETLGAAGSSLARAAEVAEVGLALRESRPKPYYETGDVRLRGLLALLRSDPRLLAFAEAELGALLAHDAARGTDLTGTLEQFFRVGANKTLLAQATHLSRPALYARLATIERVLASRLDDPDAAVSLHVALLVREMSVAQEAGPARSGSTASSVGDARRR